MKPKMMRKAPKIMPANKGSNSFVQKLNNKQVFSTGSKEQY
jgi:hypothetical protein